MPMCKKEEDNKDKSQTDCKNFLIKMDFIYQPSILRATLVDTIIFFEINRLPFH
jgi:hypothetical protein